MPRTTKGWESPSGACSHSIERAAEGVPFWAAESAFSTAAASATSLVVRVPLRICGARSVALADSRPSISTLRVCSMAAKRKWKSAIPGRRRVAA